jgi:NADPH:quinone reductase-like Zn-dependent oxidoreductase
MKAVIIDRYGTPDVLQLKEIEDPLVEDDDVLVKIRAASVNPYAWHVMTGLPYIARAQFGLFRPKVTGMGADLAGTVEAVGKNVKAFLPGDEVFGEVDGETPGQPILELGSLAEYVCVKESSVVHKPERLTFEQAAALPLAGHTALRGLRDQAGVVAGQKVLINGASGGVGTLAVQVARALGAEVTGVCSTRNLDLVRSTGAHRVIDYTREDFVQAGERYDVILDNVGNRRLSDCLQVLEPGGIYLASFGQPGNRWFGPMLQLAWMVAKSAFVRQNLVILSTKRTREALLDLKALADEGKLTPVIDRTYSLAEAIEAIRHLAKGHARGKIVISVADA